MEECVDRGGFGDESDFDKNGSSISGSHRLEIKMLLHYSCLFLNF